MAWFIFKNRPSVPSDETIVGTGVETRTLVSSCNHPWERTAVWTKVAAVKVSRVKIYFGVRTDRLVDRLHVGDGRMTSRVLA